MLGRRTLPLAIALIFGVVLDLVSATPTVVGYGESCDAGRKCNKRAFLTCSSAGICTCSRPDEMVYEAEGVEMCVMKVGEPCKYAVDVDPEGKQLFHVHTCVRNSECDPAGYCNCSNGFFENSNSTCTLGSSLGESCDNELKCSATGGLRCEGNFCMCIKSIAIEDSTARHCVGLAGKSCIEGKCVLNADCIDKSCKCRIGYYQAESGLCLNKGNIGDSCSRNEQCGKDKVSKIELVCVNGKCNCDPKNYVFAKVSRIYNKKVPHSEPYYSQFRHYDTDDYVSDESQLCAPKANMNCVQGYCAPLSTCSFRESFPENDNFQGTCTCDTGHEISKKTGFCARKYLMSCNPNIPCAFPLVCKDSKCNCELDIQDYDATSQLCLSKVNGPCRGDQDCKNKASCIIIPGSDSGHCSCSYGYAPENNDECKVAYGEKCTTATECDSVAQLLCIDGFCKCGTFSEYSFEHRKCMGLVGAACNPDDKIDCVGTAICKSPHPKLKTRCSCPLGFVETGNYTCTSHQAESPVFLKGEVVETTPKANASNSSAYSVESAISEEPVAPEDESRENETH